MLLYQLSGVQSVRTLLASIGDLFPIVHTPGMLQVRVGRLAHQECTQWRNTRCLPHRERQPNRVEAFALAAVRADQHQ